jgi:hypothetical protein
MRPELLIAGTGKASVGGTVAGVAGFPDQTCVRLAEVSSSLTARPLTAME